MTTWTCSGTPSARQGRSLHALPNVALMAPFAVCALTDAADAGSPDRSDIAYYDSCSSAAATRSLSYAEAHACAQAYLRIKLSFLPGVDPGTFATLPPVGRAELNRRGYLAFVEWRSSGNGWVRRPVAIGRD